MVLMVINHGMSPKTVFITNEPKAETLNKSNQTQLFEYFHERETQINRY
jgi:hypothetical protein